MKKAKTNGTPKLGPLDVLLTTKEAAEFLRVNQATLWRWALDGRGPKRLQFGHARTHARYRVRDLLQWMGAETDASAGQ